MEFNEKLQELRKSKGLTQDELAKLLYVSRAAVSKWESGKGYPNIDSLKAIAKLFSTTVDKLLSAEDLMTIAEADTKEKGFLFRDLIFGLTDLCIGLLFFLPFFAERGGDTVIAVSLLSLITVAPWLKITYIIIASASVLIGIFILSFQNFCNYALKKSKNKASILLSLLSVVIFILSLQPYAAAFTFALLIIKAFTLLKTQ